MLPVDASGRPLRPGILYGIDTRARAEMNAMTRALGLVGQDALTAQDAGPKIVWFRDRDPERWRRTRMIVSAHGYIVAKLTRPNVIDGTTATGFGLAHHLELMLQAGPRPDRIVAMGGASRNRRRAQPDVELKPCAGRYDLYRRTTGSTSNSASTQRRTCTPSPRSE